MWSGLPSARTGARQSAAGHEKVSSGTAPFTEAQPLAPANPRSELSLVSAVLAGDGVAAARFIEYASQTLWSAVTRLEDEGAEGEAAFLHVVAALKADGYGRLKAFDGRARLSTYLVLVARDILAERLARRFTEAPDEAWRRFARFFERDIRRRVSQRFPRAAAASTHDDAYQEICLKLIEGDYRRIRAYGGRGSFIGYVLTTVDRLLIDLIRRDSPRRRLPAAVARLSALDQAQPPGKVARPMWSGSSGAWVAGSSRSPIAPRSGRRWSAWPRRLGVNCLATRLSRSRSTGWSRKAADW